MHKRLERGMLSVDYKGFSFRYCFLFLINHFLKEAAVPHRSRCFFSLKRNHEFYLDKYNYMCYNIIVRRTTNEKLFIKGSNQNAKGGWMV